MRFVAIEISTNKLTEIVDSADASEHARKGDVNRVEDAVVEHEAVQGCIAIDIQPDNLAFVVDVFKSSNAGARENNRSEFTILE